jgi:hypothetical protein
MRGLSENMRIEYDSSGSEHLYGLSILAILMNFEMKYFRPFKCTMCDQTFVLDSHRLRHEKLHLSTMDHICEVCGKAFATRSYLRLHLSVHMDKDDPNRVRKKRTKRGVKTGRGRGRPRIDAEVDPLAQDGDETNDGQDEESNEATEEQSEPQDEQSGDGQEEDGEQSSDGNVEPSTETEGLVEQSNDNDGNGDQSTHQESADGEADADVEQSNDNDNEGAGKVSRRSSARKIIRIKIKRRARKPGPIRGIQELKPGPKSQRKVALIIKPESMLRQEKESRHSHDTDSEPEHILP